MTPLQLQFNNLVEPEVLTEGLAIIIIAVIVLFAYLGYRLRNPVIFFMWFLLVTVLVFTFVTNLSFLWFWIMLILSSLTVAITAIVRYTL